MSSLGGSAADAASGAGDLASTIGESAGKVEVGEDGVSRFVAATDDLADNPPDPGPITDMADSAKDAGKSAGSGAMGLIKFGVAVLLIGAGIGLAAWGMSEFVKAFRDFEADEIYAISVAILVFMASMIIFVAVMLKLAPAAIAAGASLWPLAGVFLALGAGVLLAGIGLSMIIQSFKDMDVSKITAIGVAVMQMAGAFAALAFGIAAMGNPLAIAGAAVLAGLIYVLSETMEDIMNVMSGMDAGIIKPLGAVFTAMGEGTDGSISTEFKEIARVLKEDMDFGEISELAEMLSELSTASDSVGAIGRALGNRNGEESVQIQIQLDEDATRALLEGEAVEAQGRTASFSFGLGGLIP